MALLERINCPADLRALRRLRTTFENVILAGGNPEPDGALPPADVPVSLVPDADGGSAGASRT